MREHAACNRLLLVALALALLLGTLVAARDVFRYFYQERGDADEVEPAAVSPDSDPADAALPGDTAS